MMIASASQTIISRDGDEENGEHSFCWRITYILKSRGEQKKKKKAAEWWLEDFIAAAALHSDAERSGGGTQLWEKPPAAAAAAPRTSPLIASLYIYFSHPLRNAPQARAYWGDFFFKCYL